jgi:hypothetical protein
LIPNVSIRTVGACVETQHGPIIAIFHQYAPFGRGSAIQLPDQFENYGLSFDEKSSIVGGKQCIRTPEGYVVPLIIQNGLACLKLRPFTDDEFEQHPHVFFTTEKTWDPSVLDQDPTSDPQWGADATNVPPVHIPGRYDTHSVYRDLVFVQATSAVDTSPQDISHSLSPSSDLLDDDDPSVNQDLTLCVPRIIASATPDFSQLRPLFGWLPNEFIRNTFARTTQYGRLSTGTHLNRAFESANPALNVHCRNEDVACNIIYADEPSFDDGSTAAVVFVGISSMVTNVYGVKNDRQFVNTLEDQITALGTPTRLLSDNGSAEARQSALNILRTLFIGHWQSEPHQQQQSPAERRIQTLKSLCNQVPDCTGADPSAWLLCLDYVCYLLNHTFITGIHNVPLTALTGITVDISPLLRFYFWEQVYYQRKDHHFPSTSRESLG